ncbi:type I-U CRISPR-associated protein Cas5/Cas6 [bacterium]|nr:type I-U CRISPR-associated protein Cas5/Cas6 [bacterium]
MPTLLLRFPGGRYHATPWGSHVNEGLIEWPPSPWRVVRALLATGYTKLGWTSDRPPPDAQALMEKLAATLPRYRLPPAVGTHSRHYMPVGTLDKGRERTTLVFDTWAQIASGGIAITWDIALADGERQLLSGLAENLGYLGRSESWVDGTIIDAETALPDGTDARPCDGAIDHRPGWEQVSLLAPMAAPAYSSWRETVVADELRKLGIETGKARRSKEEQRKLEAIRDAYPADLIACLQVETEWLRALGWSQPPGSQRVLYWRRVDVLEAGAPVPRRTRRASEPVESILLSIATASGNSHALPAVTRTLPQAELLHRAVVAHASQSPRHSRVITGRAADGAPLKERHQHAHVLPLDLDLDGHLDHVLIWAPAGLDGDAQDAVRAVRRTFTKGGTGPLRVAMAALGALSNLTSLRHPFGNSMAGLLGGAEGSPVWRSATPFVAPRFLKKRGGNSLPGQIRAELEARGLPPVTHIEVLDQRDPSMARFRHFVRVRRHGPAPCVDQGWALELRFAEPIRGPLVLGYGSHYGLGMFRAG